MDDKLMFYNILYALAAKDGREDALFGSCAPLAQQAFGRSFAGEAFPEVWFEVPLAGDACFDLHVLTSREGLDFDPADADDARVFHPEVFEWFASRENGVRQLAMSHDLSQGRADSPAVQLLVSTRDAGVTCEFLQATGRADAVGPYRTFVERLPEGWFACYTGAFPGRQEMNLRVECIPEQELQSAYAQDGSLLEAHLRQTGFDDWGDTIIPRCQELARMPFRLEFQFDVTPQGTAGTTIGASLRFDCPPGTPDWLPFETRGAGGQLMQLVESWGLADERWRLLEDAAFAKRAAFQGESLTLFNFPAFVKLRWRDGEPLDAKAYFMAGAQASRS